MADAVIKITCDGADLSASVLQKVRDAMKDVTGATVDLSGASRDAVAHTDALGHSWVLRIAEGQLLRDAVREVLGVMKEMAEFLPELAMKGAVVGDVEASFKHLAAQAGLTSDVLLGTLRAGTHGTIDDFQLMQRTNKDLAAGLDLTDAQFGTLAQGAFALAKATGGTTAEALDKMSDAMVTGRAKGVAMLTGKIDLKAAEEAYAVSLGGTAKDLTAEQKLEADREAILKHVEAALSRVGDQQDSLKDKVDQSKVSWANFEDELGKQIAQSPVIAAGYDGIHKALAAAFGTDQAGLITAITEKVNGAAIVATDFAIAGVEGARDFNIAWSLIKTVVLGVETGLATVAAGMGSTFAEIAHLQTLLPLATQATRDQAVAAQASADSLWLVAQGLDAESQEAAKGITGHSAYDQSLDALEGGLMTTRDHMLALSTSHGVAKEATEQVTAATDKHTGALKPNAAALKANADLWREYNAVGQSVYDTILRMNGATVEGIKYDLLRGESAEILVKVYGVTKEQIKAIQEEMKFLNSVGADTTKMFTDHLGLVGLVDARYGDLHDSLHTLYSATNEFTGGMTIAGDEMNNVVIPAFGTLPNVTAQATKAIEDARAPIVGTVHTLESGIGELSKAFSNLATISGGTFGGIVQDIGKMVASFDVALKSEDALAKILGPGAMGGAFDAGGMFGAPTSKGGKAAFAGAQVGAGLLASATDDPATAGGVAMNDAAKGAQMGAVAGPWGMAIGAAAGLVVGIIAGKPEWAKAADEVGRDFGAKISESLAKEIAGLAKSSFGGSEQAASISELSKIIAEAGGLTDTNLPQMEARLHDVFSMIETHQMTIAQGGKVLDDNWAAFAKAGTDATGLISKDLETIITLNDKFGTSSKAIGDYVAGQMTNAQKGFASALNVTGAAYTTLATDQKTAATQTGDALAKTNADILVQQGIIAATGLHSQAAATAVASSLTGIVAANMKAGASFIDAVRGIGPTVDALETQLEATGFAGGKAFDFIKQEVALANDKIAGPALTAVEGYTAGMVGLSNAGMLTQDTFAGLSGQIGGTEKALEAQGFSGSAVMLAMKGDLQTLWEEEQRYGYKADDVTQALIDQGVQSGLIGEQGKTDNQKILDVLMAIGTALGATIPDGLDTMASAGKIAANKLQSDMAATAKLLSGSPESIAAGATAAGAVLQADMDAASKAALTDPSESSKSLTARAIQAAAALEEKLKTAAEAAGLSLAGIGKNLSPIDLHYRFVGDNGLPSDSASAAASGGFVTDRGVEYFGAGGWVPRGTDTVPAMLTPGEGIVNRSGMSILGRDGLQALNRGGGSDGGTQALRSEIADLHSTMRGLRETLTTQQLRLPRLLIEALQLSGKF